METKRKDSQWTWENHGAKLLPLGSRGEGRVEIEHKQTFPCLVGHFIIMCRSSALDSRKSDNICFQKPLTLKGPWSKEGLSLEGLVLCRQEACSVTVQRETTKQAESNRKGR